MSVEFREIGNIATEIEFGTTPNGNNYASFSLAVDSRRFDRQQNKYVSDGASFFKCQAWGEMADAIAAMPDRYGKGKRVIVHGKLKTRNFERKDGSTGTAVEVTVSDFGPSDRFASRQPGNQNNGYNNGGYQNNGYNQQQGNFGGNQGNYGNQNFNQQNNQFSNQGQAANANMDPYANTGVNNFDNSGQDAGGQNNGGQNTSNQQQSYTASNW